MNSLRSCGQCGHPLPDYEKDDYRTLFCQRCGRWHDKRERSDEGRGVYVLDPTPTFDWYRSTRLTRPLKSIADGIAFATGWDPKARRVRVLYDAVWLEERPT